MAAFPFDDNSFECLKQVFEDIETPATSLKALVAEMASWTSLLCLSHAGLEDIKVVADSDSPAVSYLCRCAAMTESRTLRTSGTEKPYESRSRDESSVVWARAKP
jgi:hypothetical protein